MHKHSVIIVFIFNRDRMATVHTRIQADLVYKPTVYTCI